MKDGDLYKIRVRVIRRELDRTDLTADEESLLRKRLDEMIDVPAELRTTARARDLTEDQLLRVYQSREIPEDDCDPLPAFIEWKDEAWPKEGVFVAIDARTTWRAGEPTRRVGSVWIHNADENADGVARRSPEEPELDAKLRAVEIAVERGLGCVYLRKVAAGPSA